MSATEQLIERVKALNEADAKAALVWLDTHAQPGPKRVGQAELRRMDEALGFARRYRSETKTTAEWMRELREGEAD